MKYFNDPQKFWLFVYRNVVFCDSAWNSVRNLISSRDKLRNTQQNFSRIISGYGLRTGYKITILLSKWRQIEQPSGAIIFSKNTLIDFNTVTNFKSKWIFKSINLLHESSIETDLIFFCWNMISPKSSLVRWDPPTNNAHWTLCTGSRLGYWLDKSQKPRDPI